MELIYVKHTNKQTKHLKIVHVSEWQDGTDTDEIFKYSCSFQTFHNVACQQVLIFRGL